MNRDLTLLLSKTAEKGGFSTVLLCDERGLLLAANASAQHLDRLLATAGLLQSVADQIESRDGPAPRAIMIYDEANSIILCRTFRAMDQKLALLVITSDAQLTPAALDPALVNVQAMLSAP
jgi:hypothetical protein